MPIAVLKDNIIPSVCTDDGSEAETKQRRKVTSRSINQMDRSRLGHVASSCSQRQACECDELTVICTTCTVVLHETLRHSLICRKCIGNLENFNPIEKIPMEDFETKD